MAKSLNPESGGGGGGGGVGVEGRRITKILPGNHHH